MSAAHRSAGRTRSSVLGLQTGTSLALGALVLGIFGAVSRLSRSEALLRRIESLRLHDWMESSSIYTDRSGFVNVSDRLFLERIPSVDHSRGGVYFLGASNQVGAPMVWSLPTEERALVHNYAVLGASHSDQRDLVRYLIEHEGLGEAGSRAMIVLALSWPYSRPTDYFGEIFRYGLYQHSRAEGLEPVEMTRLERLLRIERARCHHILVTLRRTFRLGPGLDVRFRESKKASPRHWPERYRRAATRYLGEDWRDAMTSEVQALGETVELLQERGLVVVGVLLPVASWDRDQPYARSYEKEVIDILSSRDVPTLDLSALLEDEEYHDYIHPNYEGSAKCHEALIGLAREHLARTGRSNDEN